MLIKNEIKYMKHITSAINYNESPKMSLTLKYLYIFYSGRWNRHQNFRKTFSVSMLICWELLIAYLNAKQCFVTYKVNIVPKLQKNIKLTYIIKISYLMKLILYLYSKYKIYIFTEAGDMTIFHCLLIVTFSLCILSKFMF